ncbi:MAG: MBL fold metallo-hydrolase RNA specificity domain-containing protein [Candidatus Limnocylindrales bacterium]
MDVHFLGAANTVTGSQFLVTTDSARILVDCGMFQGSPNEVVRNQVPLAFDPGSLDAIVLTHAHLDHCGLIPHVVAQGFTGPIYATRGTVELAGLVLLDSGKLQEEFAKREARWARRHPERAAREELRREQKLHEQEGLVAANETVSLADGTVRPAALTDASAEGTAAAADSLGEPISALLHPSTGGGTLPPAATPMGRLNPEHAILTAPAGVDAEIEEPLYGQREAHAALEHFHGVDYGQSVPVAPGIVATFLDAGHILGSATIRLEVEPGPGHPARTLVFSGDLGQAGTPILRDPTRVHDADYVFVESTYGGREHEPQAEAVRLLAEAVRLFADHDGVLLVPSFAIGRTQEIVWELNRLVETGSIPQLRLYLDSPMASHASDIYRRYSDYYDEETRALLAQHEAPLDFPSQIITNDFRDSQAISLAPRPYMIVASNGMLTGGRVLGHLRELVGDARAVLLFVGYQGEGTLGAHLQAGAKTVRIDGETHPVRCQVRSISGFSAHADEAGILTWLGAFMEGRHPGDAGVPKRVFIVHGDPEAQEALEPKVRSLGFETLVPHWHERVLLD